MRSASRIGSDARRRWIAHHSQLRKEHGDSIVLGASSPEQLEANLVAIEKGPLSDEVVAAIDAAWIRNRDAGFAKTYTDMP